MITSNRSKILSYKGTGSTAMHTHLPNGIIMQSFGELQGKSPPGTPLRRSGLPARTQKNCPAKGQNYIWCARRESNPRLRLRRPPSYPLNYERSFHCATESIVSYCCPIVQQILNLQVEFLLRLGDNNIPAALGCGKIFVESFPVSLADRPYDLIQNSL